jgi:hypothetical protein
MTPVIPMPGAPPAAGVMVRARRVLPARDASTDHPARTRKRARICSASALLLLLRRPIHARRRHATAQVRAPISLRASSPSLPVSVVPAVLLIL